MKKTCQLIFEIAGIKTAGTILHPHVLLEGGEYSFLSGNTGPSPMGRVWCKNPGTQVGGYG